MSEEMSEITADKPRRGRPPRESREDIARDEARSKLGEYDDPVGVFEEMSFSEDLLPTPPKIPGFHLCWLTTNGIGDSIASRQRAGYVPVHPDEVPGFAAVSGQNAQNTPEIIQRNEMVLYKIRSELHDRLKSHYHGAKPMESVRQMSEKYREYREKQGRHGMAVFGRPDED